MKLSGRANLIIILLVSAVIFCAHTIVATGASSGVAQRTARGAYETEEEFGPIVRAYLGYLRNQQEVVDDRASRHEIDRNYYLRNSNRIRALRRMAIQIARETDNDYMPELEAVAPDEFEMLFDEPPSLKSLVVGEVLNFQFRYLGLVPSGRYKFHIFARLDPYEQAELRKQKEAQKKAEGATASPEEKPASDAANVRPRTVSSPRKD